MTTPQPVKEMVEATVKKAVDNFLGWELPDFYPDGGITFNRIANHTAVGTNLFSAIEASEMFEFAFKDFLTTAATKLYEAGKAEGERVERERCAVEAWNTGMDLYMQGHDSKEIGAIAAKRIRSLPTPPKQDNNKKDTNQ